MFKRDSEDYIQSFMPSVMAYQDIVAVHPGIILKNLMKAQGINIKQLSQKTNIPLGRIQEIYDNHALPDDTTGEKLSVALHQRKDFFFYSRLDYMKCRSFILDSKYGLKNR